MKKYNIYLAIILFILTGYIIQPLTPWWSLAPIALVVVLIFQLSPTKSTIVGFLGGFILWGIVAFLQDNANQGILSSRIGGMLGGLPGLAVPLFTAIIGGITASLGALVGSLGRGLITSNK